MANDNRDRNLDGVIGFLRVHKCRAFGRTQSHDESDEHEHSADKERYPPAPGREALTGYPAEKKEDNVTENQNSGNSYLDPAPEETVTPLRRVLDNHENGTTVLTTESKSLHEPQRDQDNRCRNTDGLIARQQADRERGNTHDRERQHQHGFSPDTRSPK